MKKIDNLDNIIFMNIDSFEKQKMFSICKASNTIDIYADNEFIISNIIILHDDNKIHASCNEEFIEKFIREILIKGKQYRFSFIKIKLLNCIKKYFNVFWENEFKGLIFAQDKIPLETIPNNIKCRQLNFDDIGTVCKYYLYDEKTKYDYVQKIIKIYYSVGIEKNNKLISWILTNYDSSIGLLHTLPNYRKCGYAELAVRKMIYILVADNKIPFVTVKDNNKECLNLMKKIGFIYHDVYFWLEGIKI